MEHEIKREEHERLKNELNKCSESLDKVKEDNLALNRSISKKDKEIDEAHQKMDKLETEYLELLEKYDREHKLNSQLSIDRQFSSIPMACFVNAIKDKNIVIIGGDHIHSRLRDYGLNNARFYKAGCRELSNEDIINTDMIVIVTPYVDHASIEVVTRAARNHGLKLLNFNNKNADMLICKVFEELNK